MSRTFCSFRTFSPRAWIPAAWMLAVCASSALAHSDHREFDATLYVPYSAPYAAAADAAAARTFTLTFDYPFVAQPQNVHWRVELVSQRGQVLQRWHGIALLDNEPVTVNVHWEGRTKADGGPDGVYTVRMLATATARASSANAGSPSVEAIDSVLAAAGDAAIEQSWQFAVGLPRAATLAGATPATPPMPALPYTVYLGNLHSQTNHSDGGGELGACKGSQEPQSGAEGPAAAFEYGRKRGLEILVASEHNHMYDGSDGTEVNADPVKARVLYQAGLAAAAAFNTANHGYLAVYGLEWGVISNGGHLNIFNSPELLQWEVNGAGQLIGDTLTPKNDYAALYTLMRQRGWIGQFNHPSTSGQFKIGGVALGYHPDGDQAMALCEVLNTSAFSVNTTETEKRRSNFEEACNKALEAGFHVAFSSNQDNHCANWGASYTNRTGVLIPTGTALSQTSFVESLRARRVFATMDKGSRLILMANGHIMGERFVNRRPLKLNAHFASSSGKRAASVLLMQGVPGRNGKVSVLAPKASSTFTPSLGEHFYYAKLTQEDGNILWSAPVWVTQKAKVRAVRKMRASRTR